MEEDMPKLSVIVPVYNVQEYLPICIKSILDQTYKDYELILIDDGSKDNSSLICDEFKKQDSRIKVVHKENGGLSDARNTGLREATGRYISFVDSDDFIKKDMYEILIKELESYNVDFIKSNFISDNSDDNEDNISNEYKVNIYSSEEAIEDFFVTAYDNDKPMKSTVCDGVYKREIFYDNKELIVEFPIGKINEDTYIFPWIVFRAKKIAHINRAFYCYRDREESIIHSDITVREIRSRDLWKCVSDVVSKYTNKYIPICANNHIMRSLRILERIYHSGYQDEYFNQVRKDVIKESNGLICYINDIRIKRALKLIKCYPLYVIIKKILGNKIY